MANFLKHLDKQPKMILDIINFTLLWIWQKKQLECMRKGKKHKPKMNIRDNKIFKILQAKKINLKNLLEIYQKELKVYGINLLKNELF